jgi:hypothetical protein
MSLLCLELYTPGEISIGTDWLTLVVGVTCGNTARMGVGVGVLCSVFPLGVDMGGLVLGNLEALEMGLVLGLAFEAVLAGKRNLSLGGGRPPGDAMAACCLVNLVGVHGGSWFASLGGGRPPGDAMAACCLVNLVGVHGGSWFASLGGGRPPGDAMAACCLVNLVGVHGGSWFASLGGGRPAGNAMAACCLVNLVGVHGGSWFAAAICAVFCFLVRVPGTIARTCQEKHASYRLRIMSEVH